MADTKQMIEPYKSLVEWGDIPELVKLTGLSRSSIYKLFYKGECFSPTAKSKVGAFYAKRKAERERNEKIIQDQD